MSLWRNKGEAGSNVPVPPARSQNATDPAYRDRHQPPPKTRGILETVDPFHCIDERLLEHIVNLIVCTEQAKYNACEIASVAQVKDVEGGRVLPPNPLNEARIVDVRWPRFLPMHVHYSIRYRNG